VSSVDKLEDALDEIEFEALIQDRVYQVDMRRLSYQPRDGDPVLIQILIGDPSVGCLLWHEDGETFSATERDVAKPTVGMSYVRMGGVHAMETCCMQIRSTTARDALVLFVMTNSRPDISLEWVLAPMD
jgi:hypothetical protein